jgi:hypothetical protein
MLTGATFYVLVHVVRHLVLVFAISSNGKPSKELGRPGSSHGACARFEWDNNSPFELHSYPPPPPITERLPRSFRQNRSSS